MDALSLQAVAGATLELVGELVRVGEQGTVRHRENPLVNEIVRLESGEPCRWPRLDSATSDVLWMSLTRLRFDALRELHARVHAAFEERHPLARGRAVDSWGALFLFLRYITTSHKQLDLAEELGIRLSAVQRYIVEMREILMKVLQDDPNSSISFPDDSKQTRLANLSRSLTSGAVTNVVALIDGTLCPRPRVAERKLGRGSAIEDMDFNYRKGSTMSNNVVITALDGRIVGGVVGLSGRVNDIAGLRIIAADVRAHLSEDFKVAGDLGFASREFRDIIRVPADRLHRHSEGSVHHRFAELRTRAEWTFASLKKFALRITAGGSSSIVTDAQDFTVACLLYNFRHHYVGDIEALSDLVTRGLIKRQPSGFLAIIGDPDFDILHHHPVARVQAVPLFGEYDSLLDSSFRGLRMLRAGVVNVRAPSRDDDSGGSLMLPAEVMEIATQTMRLALDGHALCMDAVVRIHSLHEEKKDTFGSMACALAEANLSGAEAQLFFARSIVRLTNAAIARGDEHVDILVLQEQAAGGRKR